MADAPPVERDRADGTAAARRPVELRAARLHLRGSLYALARVELETLAGAGTLDEEGLLDLAEIRWRTGDLTGAGEAAAAYLATGRITLLALVIASEATAALGRPAEARRLAGRALELASGPLDPVFAGMPRSSIWPNESLDRVEPLHAPGAAGPEPPLSSSPDRPDASVEAAVSADAELSLARTALARGDRSNAVVHLAVVLRLAPALAAAVLDLVAAESGPEFDLIRGDALRLVGRESQARRAYAAAARLAAEGSSRNLEREEGS